jgi:hypothetical protein
MLGGEGGVEGLQLLEGERQGEEGLGEKGLMEGLTVGVVVAAGREIQRGYGRWRRGRNGWFLIEMG